MDWGGSEKTYQRCENPRSGVLLFRFPRYCCKWLVHRSGSYWTFSSNHCGHCRAVRRSRHSFGSGAFR